MTISGINLIGPCISFASTGTVRLGITFLSLAIRLTRTGLDVTAGSAANWTATAYWSLGRSDLKTPSNWRETKSRSGASAWHRSSRHHAQNGFTHPSAHYTNSPSWQPGSQAHRGRYAVESQSILVRDPTTIRLLSYLAFADRVSKFYHCESGRSLPLDPVNPDVLSFSTPRHNRLGPPGDRSSLCNWPGSRAPLLHKFLRKADPLSTP